MWVDDAPENMAFDWEAIQNIESARIGLPPERSENPTGSTETVPFLASFADEILRRDGRMNAAVGVIWAKLTGRSGFRVLGA